MLPLALSCPLNLLSSMSYRQRYRLPSSDSARTSSGCAARSCWTASSGGGSTSDEVSFCSFRCDLCVPTRSRSGAACHRAKEMKRGGPRDPRSFCHTPSLGENEVSALIARTGAPLSPSRIPFSSLSFFALRGHPLLPVFLFLFVSRSLPPLSANGLLLTCIFIARRSNAH